MSYNADYVECSVVVCTYNSDWEKLRLTLRSVLMQEDCNYSIVVADDGSRQNHFDKIRSYFNFYDFDNYKLVASHQNQGTTNNILHGVYACTGEFVKPLSPGDFLHGKQVLRKWVDFMRSKQECIMSFCDAIYYRMENGRIIATKEFAHPQYARACNEDSFISKYLICNDICLGAATMLRRDWWIKYLEMIIGKVVYAEDNSYRIMMYAGEKFAHIAYSFMLYENGAGISTKGSKVWAERLRKDWRMADKIMLSIEPCVEANHLHIPEFLRIADKIGWKARLRRWKIAPSRIFFVVKCRLFPNRTPVNLDEDFVLELLIKDDN